MVYNKKRNRILNGYTDGDDNGIGEPKNFDATLEGCKGHGVACAGIIAAENNTIGIRGIASSAQIIPINIAPYTVKDISKNR